MNRIDARFETLKKDGKKALITFITAGDPDLPTTERLVRTLEKSGADLVELGVPFSDPIADGPTIQKASERALARHVSLRKVLSLVARLRKKTGIPIVLLTYYNPVMKYGLSRFARDAHRAGVDGLVVPDLSFEESEPLADACGTYGMHVISLLAPTSPSHRMRMIAGRAGGFIYYVSLTGVTGARRQLPAGIVVNLQRLKKTAARPVCVGFGIASPETAKTAARYADGVIVGSAIVDLIAKNQGKRDLPAKVGRFVRTLARAVHEEKR